MYLGTEDFIEYTKLKDTGALKQVDYVLTRLHEFGSEWGDQTINGWLSIREDTYMDPDKTYRCGNIERVSFDKDGVHYELGNSVDTVSYPTLAECTNTNFDNPYERNFSMRYNEENTDFSSWLYFRDDKPEFSSLSSWINVIDKSAELDPLELINHFGTLPYLFDEEVIVDTSYWRKRKTYDNIVIDKDNENNWVKTTTLDDGTREYECSSDGETWVACEG